MATELARQKAAAAWCRPSTSNKVMDGDLAEAFAEILDEVWSQPWLGNATTGELLDEIKARVDCSYRTVGRRSDPPTEIAAPTGESEARIERLKKALAGMIGTEIREELVAMEAVLRATPGIEADKIGPINAIHALLSEAERGGKT